MTEPLIRDISDTARWAAVYRAQETDRPDALYRDPLARRLAGDRGQQIADAQPGSARHTWAWVTRTVLFDRFITEQVQAGADMVVNLAAGFDARPYRLDVPPALRWIEIDLPHLIREKRSILQSERPRCALERIELDLADVPARQALFAELGRAAQRILVVSEGLIIYLTPDDVASLARDLAAAPSFRWWTLDLASPGLVAMLQQQLGPLMAESGAKLQFGPEEGPGFFAPHGWQPCDIRSLLKTAARLGRLSLWMRVLSLLPESHGKQGNRPWSAVCLMGRGG